MNDYTRPQNLPDLSEFDWDADDEEDDGRGVFYLCDQEDHRRSTDQRGHSDTISKFRMPQGSYARIAEVVEHKSTPYRSVAEFVRDAVLHRLQEVTEWLDDDMVSREVEIIMATARAEAMIVKTESKRQLVEARVRQINGALEVQHWSAVREGVEAAKEMLIFLDINTHDLASCVEAAERELERHFGN